MLEWQTGTFQGRVLFKSVWVQLPPSAPLVERTWRNWYTLTLEVRMEQSVQVQVLSSAHVSGSIILAIFLFIALKKRFATKTLRFFPKRIRNSKGNLWGMIINNIFRSTVFLMIKGIRSSKNRLCKIKT